MGKITIRDKSGNQFVDITVEDGSTAVVIGPGLVTDFADRDNDFSGWTFTVHGDLVDGTSTAIIES